MRRLHSPFVYSGGKGKMIKKLLPLLPRGKIYVEPYCGSAAVFFAKQPSPQEVLGDLDDRVVNFFPMLTRPEVVQAAQMAVSEHSLRTRRVCKSTAYSRQPERLRLTARVGFLCDCQPGI